MLAGGLVAEPAPAADAREEIGPIRNCEREHAASPEQLLGAREVGQRSGHVLEHVPECDRVQAALFDVRVLDVGADQIDARGLDL